MHIAGEGSSATERWWVRSGRVPEAIDGYDVDPVLGALGLLADVERNTGDEESPSSSRSVLGPFRSFPATLVPALTLDGDDPAVVEFEDQVDLDAVVGAPVAGAGDCREP